MGHAVSRLRAARLARSAKPFLARGSRSVRCPDCRLPVSHCMCALCPIVGSEVGVCLIMADIEPIKPTNTGWLIADVVTNTFAFGWARTEVDPALLALLADPQWQPYLVFPGAYVAPERVVTQLIHDSGPRSDEAWRRPLFVLLDATWQEARKMFRKSPYLDHLPVLSLQPDQLSRYRLRRAQREAHLCTAEVAAMCLELAGEALAADTLNAWFDVFCHHYLNARRLVPTDLESAAHQRLRSI